MNTLKILVVDDEAIARAILSRPLRAAGHTVLNAASGNIALDVMENEQVDLVLLDMGMRDGDGFSVLHRLMKDHTVRWVPVIVISGDESEEMIANALQLGADDYIVKPVNIEFLAHKVRNYERIIGLQKQNQGLLNSVIQKQKQLEDRISFEFELGTRIQQTLLMGNVPVVGGGLFTSARAQASQGVNGDFIEIITVFPDTVDFIMGDVMGKGPLAGILGADLKLQVQRQITNRLITKPSERFSVAEIVNLIHLSLTPKLIKIESFVSFLYGRIDKVAGTLTIVCCGHPPIVVMGKERSFLFGSHNLPFGILLEESYTEEVCLLGKGDAIICYSDGLTEASNNEREEFGVGKLLETLAPYGEARWGANALVELVYASVMNFVGDKPLQDDLTMVVVKVPDSPELPFREVLPRALSGIATLRSFVGQFGSSVGLSEDLVGSITLVMVEAFTNTVRHSIADVVFAAVEIQAVANPDMIWFTLEARGPYFDPQAQVPEPIAPFDLDREGGFGLHIITALTDEFSYSHHSGVNCMKFGFRVPEVPQH
jgi:serine phosphatase RsbU (regulator of sigma subunit)/anti-sigma regulatory factor (Ser/Thr protein kinase)